MKVNELFPLPVLSHQVDSNLANRIENLIVSRIDMLEKKESVQTDFFTKNRIVSLEELKPLVKEINKCINFYCQHLSHPETELFNYWIQDYKDQNFHHKHNHGRCDFSVVYWVRADSKSGKLLLENPNPYVPVFYHSPQETKYTIKQQFISPIKGGLIIFPGYINHEVLKGENGSKRTTIAFNYLKQY